MLFSQIRTDKQRPIKHQSTSQLQTNVRANNGLSWQRNTRIISERLHRISDYESRGLGAEVGDFLMQCNCNRITDMRCVVGSW